ncbi:MAG: HD domain-containing protein, partial [bacterium]
MELKDTKLWKIYARKTRDTKRKDWVSDVYDTAVEQLKAVRDTFPNYTLHDATHVLNVLHAMAGLLGDEAKKLTVAELELLILSAALHDIGMVYTEADRDYALTDEQQCKDFINEKRPDLYGVEPQEWPDDIKQWYWRDRHPFRVNDVLCKPVWEDLFSHCPNGILSRGTIVAVCRSHGEGRKEIHDDSELKYDRGDGTDPRFCALLLRLADLLDFDDTRTPKILLEFAAGSDKSTEEWKKHLSSKGFKYPDTPSPNELDYEAECTSPDIEHAIRDYLNWIDDELYNCRDLQRQCCGWRAVFPFPLRVSRENITN